MSISPAPHLSSVETFLVIAEMIVKITSSGYLDLDEARIKSFF